MDGVGLEKHSHLPLATGGKGDVDETTVVLDTLHWGVSLCEGWKI